MQSGMYIINKIVVESWFNHIIFQLFINELLQYTDG
jgi:hypothetical protein